MGSGSSKGGSRHSPNRNEQPGGNHGNGTPSSSRCTTYRTGWEWFEINFSTMELADDSEDEGDDEMPSELNSPSAPVPGTTVGGGSSTDPAPTAGPAVGSSGAGGGNEPATTPSPSVDPAPAAEPDPGSAPSPSPAPAPTPPKPDTPKPVTPEPTKLPLSIMGLDLNEKTNAEKHHTDEYEEDSIPELIVRRGQEFILDFKLNRKYDPDIETIILRFVVTGTRPKPTNRTLMSLPLDGKFEEDEWSVKIESSEEKFIKLSVKSAPTAIVGLYNFTVVVKYLKSGARREFTKHKKKLTMLFNPWCDKDPVFLESDAERKEYVLEDSGRIWRGSANNFRSMQWNFGQFDKDVREVVFQLLMKHIKAEDRWSPIRVSRVMSHIINKAGRDDAVGILVGNWSGDYEGGTRPTKWNGSFAILEEYKKTGGPVLYGQCWVFSGVFTTILRCLGIPARSVTNFASAHDTDANMTIDKYIDLDGNDMANGHDSVWNFHVWNEAWMTRPDIDPLLGGWQAVDSTPQETSDGKFQCGPAPVKAVKKGLVNQGYDTKFVFAEVNSDRVTWQVKRSRINPGDSMMASYNPISINKNSVGKNISTKAVGSNDRNDVTHEYKYPEGSAEERAAVIEAVNKGMSHGIYSEEGSPQDVTFIIDGIQDVWMGQDFTIKLKAINKSDGVRTILMKLKIESCYYTGIALELIKREKLSLKLGPGEEVEKDVEIKVDDYIDKIEDQGLLSVFALVSILEAGSTNTLMEEMRLKIPDLEVNSDVTGSEVKLTVEFENPLKRTLTDCEFVVEAPKLVKPFTVKHPDIGPGEKIRKEIKFKARARGKKEVLVEFDSQYLRDVTGSVVVEVRDV